MNQKEVGAAVKKGIAYLESCQRPDGSFATYLSKDDKTLASAREVATVFTPALILIALASVVESQAIRQKLADWLLAQKSQNWSFNYWAKGEPERKTRTYPDDLDDTFCALSALWLYDQKIVDGAALARAVRLLVATEQEVGGPYRTWLVSGSGSGPWHNVDLTVNCNIAYFLRLAANPLPKLDAMMEQAIQERSFTSIYYPFPLTVQYCMARAYSGQLRTELAKLIMSKRRHGHWGTPGRTAQALAALHHLGFADSQDKALKYLVDQQLPDGSWPKEAFWLDEVRGKEKFYAGSEALATVFALEALSLYSKEEVSGKQGKSGLPPLYAEVMGYAVQQTANVQEPLRSHVQYAVKRVQMADTNREIVLLPSFFSQALGSPKTHTQDLLVRLGAASFFGWMAYTIYDDFLDDEGDARLLSVANVALRQSLMSFRKALPKHDAYQRFVEQTFDRIDAANAWEVENCRFMVSKGSIRIGAMPKYGQVTRLAGRSCGHMLTPLGLLVNMGVELDDKRTKMLTKALEHYLAARQLNDDLHDWQQDIGKGHISYVVAVILNDLGVQAGPQRLGVLLPQMERQFWHHSLKKVCRTVLRQLVLSRDAYAAAGLFTPKSAPLALLDELEASMNRTLQEQRNATDFLNAYTK